MTKSWNEDVAERIANGCQVIAPNELPIVCVRHDGACMEHEEADHPGYLFPVVAKYTGEIPSDLPDWDDSFMPRTLALLHATGWVVLTIYECTYDIWAIGTGECLGGHHERRSGWRLTAESLEKIRKLELVK